MRSVKDRLPLPKASAPARPETAVTLQWERFGLIAKEFPVLFKQHWAEIALNQDKIPLDPNWEQYFNFDLADVLNVLTVRANGVLVGYVFVLVFPHLHYCSTAWAQTDMFWLDPAYRQGWTGVKMFRETERHVKARGCKVLHVVVKLHFEAGRGTLGKVLQRLGYKAVETVWGKFIG